MIDWILTLFQFYFKAYHLNLNLMEYFNRKIGLVFLIFQQIYDLKFCTFNQLKIRDANILGCSIGII